MYCSCYNNTGVLQACQPVKAMVCALRLILRFIMLPTPNAHTSQSFYRRLSLTMWPTCEPCDVSFPLVHIVSHPWVMHCKPCPCLNNRAQGHPPSKRKWSSHSKTSFLNIKPQALLRQHTDTHPSFLDFYTPCSFWRNTKNVDIGYYALAVRTIQNIWVLFTLIDHTRNYSHPISESLKGFL
jgi:hypothetical protein